MVEVTGTATVKFNSDMFETVLVNMIAKESRVRTALDGWLKTKGVVKKSQGGE